MLQGFDGMVIDRLNEKEKNERRKSRNMNFVWTGNHNIGKFFLSLELLMKPTY